MQLVPKLFIPAPLALTLIVEEIKRVTEATPLITLRVPAAAVRMGHLGASRTQAAVAVWAGANTR